MDTKITDVRVVDPELPTNNSEIISDKPQLSNPSSGRSLLMFFGILLILMSLFSAFMFYQNKQLREELVNLTKVAPTIAPSPESTPTAHGDWETFSSSVYEFKYPGDFTLIEDEGSMATILKIGPTQKEGTEVYDGISITFQPREIPDISLDVYVYNTITEIEKIGISKVIKQPEKITISNYDGLTYTEEGLGTFENIVLASEDGKLFMEISILVTDPGDLGFEEISKEILSTFKFK